MRARTDMLCLRLTRPLKNPNNEHYTNPVSASCGDYKRPVRPRRDRALKCQINQIAALITLRQAKGKKYQSLIQRTDLPLALSLSSMLVLKLLLLKLSVLAPVLPQ